MQQLHEDLWTSDSPLRFLGLEVGARMTVIRLPGDELLLHSPVAANEALLEEVRTLGRVAFIVAPNCLHHLFIADWQQAFPDAATYIAHGVEKKQPGIEFAAFLGREPEPAWQNVLDQAAMDGFPFANEVVFFHRPSATLIATDIAFNIGDTSPPATRFFFRLAGAYRQLAPTVAERFLIRDRAAFGHSLRRVLDWPFERVIVAHGEISETGGRDQLVQGYAWLLGDDPA